MPYIMMKIRNILLLVFLTVALNTFAQNNNLTASPYSLFGLGVYNEAGPGKTYSLGKSGIALESTTEINNLNPASLASYTAKSFLFDIGFNGEFSSYENKLSQDNKWRTSFSSIAMAFPVTKKSAASIVLTPFTNVGYELISENTNIEGSQNTYTSYINGNGGLNSIKANYGFKLGNKLNLGASMEYIFGNIQENEIITTGSSYLTVDRDTYYKNLRFTVGSQYHVNKNTGIAAVVKFPTILNASQNLTASKIIDYATVTVDNREGINSKDFKLPWEFSVGFKRTFANVVTLNADYKKTLWNKTNQSDNIGTFKDEDMFGFGLEYAYAGKGNIYKYGQKIKYRAGFSSDNGYLNIMGETISNRALTLGVGLPLSLRNNSFINIGYSYGQRGVISTNLIRENYHIITINLSLENTWFVKSRFN